MSKTRNTFCIILSALALILFAAYYVCTYVLYLNPIIPAYALWENSHLNDLFLALPFVGLLVFSILERLLKSVNPRWFFAGVIALFLPHFFFLISTDGFNSFSALCCPFFGLLNSFSIAFLIMRLLLLIHSFFMPKLWVWFYSIAVIGSSLGLVYSELASFWRTEEPATTVLFIVSVAADVLFHVALLLFGGCLQSDNKIHLNLPPLSSIWENEEDEEENEENDQETDSVSHDDNDLASATEVGFKDDYQKVLLCALEDGDEAFFAAHAFFENLAYERLTDENGLYPVETYQKYFSLLREKIREIDEKKPGFMEEDLAKFVDWLLGLKELKYYRAHGLLVAQMLMGRDIPGWGNAYMQYIHYVLKARESGDSEDSEKTEE